MRTRQFSNDSRLKTAVTSLCYYSLRFGVWFGFLSVWGLFFFFPSEFLLSVKDVMLLGKLAVQIQHPALRNTPESPLFQEAVSPVDCILFHHRIDF